MPRFSSANFRAPAALACFFLTVVIGVSLDLWTKKLAFDRLAPEGVVRTSEGRVYVREPHDLSPDGRPAEGPNLRVYRFIPLWLHFQPMANQGAVFGSLQGQRWLFVAVSIAAIIFILYLFATSGNARLYQFILGLLLAGVLGNLYDRLFLGYVRDMIYIFPSRKLLGREVFPWIFNVADSLLCVGVFLIFVYSLRAAPRERGQAPSEKLPAVP